MPSNRRLISFLAASAFLLSGFLTIGASALAATKEKVLYSFKANGTDGRNPYAALTSDTAGNLYGTTYLGGVYGAGSAFELSPATGGTWTETVLYSFSGGDDGGNPWGGLIFDAVGNLYGTTQDFGLHGHGNVFELTPTGNGTWTETVLYSFSGPDGDQPIATIVFDASGNLYGTTYAGGAFGGGTVFELTPSLSGEWTETVLYSFCVVRNCRDGKLPYDSVVFGATGNLYFTTAAGGKPGANVGTLSELMPGAGGTWMKQKLHTFCSEKNCTDGAAPLAGLIFDADGNLYGTTTSGGAYGPGAVFRLSETNGKWKEQVLHNFGKAGDGERPQASLIFDAAGNLYGTTETGGAYRFGTVFKLKHEANGQWKERVLHSFKGKDGAQLEGSLIFDAAGNLYGTTYVGGAHSSGTVFEITP